MTWYGTVFSLIDLRSFSSLWFWIVLAVSWSAIAQRPMGVPYDMVLRARRRGGQHMADLETLVGIHIRRDRAIMGSAGVGIVGFWAALLTVVAILGFGYGAELAQALTLLFVPWWIVGVLRYRLSMRLAQGGAEGEALCRRLTWHRAAVQVIGFTAIVVTALWGIWVNASIRTLG